MSSSGNCADDLEIRPCVSSVQAAVPRFFLRASPQSRLQTDPVFDCQSSDGMTKMALFSMSSDPVFTRQKSLLISSLFCVLRRSIWANPLWAFLWSLNRALFCAWLVFAWISSPHNHAHQCVHEPLHVCVTHVHLLPSNARRVCFLQLSDWRTLEGWPGLAQPWPVQGCST